MLLRFTRIFGILIKKTYPCGFIREFILIFDIDPTNKKNLSRIIYKTYLYTHQDQVSNS